MLRAYKVGDRVMSLPEGEIRSGVMGTVVQLNNHQPTVSVVFDENISGHELRSTAPHSVCGTGCGWNCSSVHICLIDITLQGKSYVKR